jgi:hypothetical protein
MRTIALLLTLLTAACAVGVGATGDLVLERAPESLRAGETITLTLRNGTSEQVGYNLCTSALERESGGAWAPVPTDRMCTMELRTLEPGAEADYPYELPTSLAAGRYRLSAGVTMMGSREQRVVATEPFQVTN